MVWNYFTQFWNNVSEVVITGGTYTVSWFQSIGNAVGGAIGAFFDVIVHYITDGFLFISWLAFSLKTIFIAMLSPISYFFQILKSFVTTAFNPATAPTVSYLIPDYVLEILDAIPHFATFELIIGSMIILIIGISSVKLLNNI